MKLLTKLIDKFSREREWGFTIDCRTYAGINGYGHMCDWIVFITQLDEFCIHCRTNPNHSGNHKWAGKWVEKHQGSAHNLEDAIKMALDRYEQGEK